jgi:hypothetical protein
MEVVQLKKGGKVKRRRAKAKQPLQTQRQVVNINMGRGGGGGAMIGSTHTFSQQPPMFYNAIREVPNAPVNYGDNPFRVSVGVGTAVGEAQIPESGVSQKRPEPNAPTSIVSNPNPMAPRLLPITPARGRGQLSYKRQSQGVPRRAISPSASVASSSSGYPGEQYDDIRPPQALAYAEPHDEYKMSEQGEVAATASSSAAAGAMGAQLPLPLLPKRGRPPKLPGAPTAPYTKSEGFIPPKYRATTDTP